MVSRFLSLIWSGDQYEARWRYLCLFLLPGLRGRILLGHHARRGLNFWIGDCEPAVAVVMVNSKLVMMNKLPWGWAGWPRRKTANNPLSNVIAIGAAVFATEVASRASRFAFVRFLNGPSIKVQGNGTRKDKAGTQRRPRPRQGGVRGKRNIIGAPDRCVQSRFFLTSI